MRIAYNKPCKFCGSTKQIFFDDEDRKSIFCENCNHYEDVYASEELKQHWADEARAKAKAEEQAKLQQFQNMPKCPICGLIELSKIIVAKRAIKAGLFGIFGAVDDAGKTWKCNNCGSKF
ncbi:MAG: hypothetical protein J6C64_00675 [Lachnospiraceae bacterium]|nr:hypothetical protein [Lachnospiraceae bacterium]